MSNTTISPSLSDLFFNHTHDKFDVVVVSSKSTVEEREQAINDDALKFVNDFAPIIPELGQVGDSGGEAARTLAADFLERL